ncbi:2-keto-4-pentenoate hydratase, partial [Vandammella animalimorsus]
MTSIQRIADRLWQAHISGTCTHPVREELARLGDARQTLHLAYQVQQELTHRRLQSGARLVGRKIG